MPISKEDLKALLDYLDTPNSPPCDHTLKKTLSFLKGRRLDLAKIVPWLKNYGGYCDCEVIFNVDGGLGEYVGRKFEGQD